MYFLKLGGSLITDKTRPHTFKAEAMARLAQEILAARLTHPAERLLLGHGSGSFGHVPGKQYGTRQGVHSSAEWIGFAEVWHEARALNQLVTDTLCQVGLPVVSLPPSAAVTAQDGMIQDWNLFPLRMALEKNLLPLIQGDVAFDTQRGGTILSTEDSFFFLAPHLQPQRILLAGVEAGVWADYPQRTRLIREITPAHMAALRGVVHGSEATDVTGGMLAKVESMLALVQQIPGLEICIFSGVEPGLVQRALAGDRPGTVIHS